MRDTLRGCTLVGTGSKVPDRVLTNADLEKMVDTSDEWIVSRSGIRERRISGVGEAVTDLALPAAQAALEMAGLSALDLDKIIVATVTPDRMLPSASCTMQERLGATHAAAFDLNAACSGFVYGMGVGASLIASGAADTVLVIGAETLSKIVDYEDRSTCVLFGDGAGAVVLEASDTPGIVASELHADGRHVGILCVPGSVSGGKVLGDPLLKMDGQAVFKLAVGVLENVARSVLAKAGRTDADIDWLIPHQANIRIMQSTAKKLKLPADKLVVTVDEHGNTSAASIPLALDAAVQDGRIRRGDTVLLEGVGGGFTWGAVLLDF